MRGFLSDARLADQADLFDWVGSPAIDDLATSGLIGPEDGELEVVHPLRTYRVHTPEELDAFFADTLDN